MSPDPSRLAVRVRVPAKVNLELRVGPLRDDGFHSLATVFHAVDLFDDVYVTPAAHWGCTVRGPYADRVPTGPDNLAVQAAQRLAQQVGIEEALQIDIDKRIPVAGGMAGGSADAAGALVGADALWILGHEPAQLMQVAAQVGSDVPFGIAGGTALGIGRGEQLVPVLAHVDLYWVFALQHEGLSTARVYAECDRLRAGNAVHEPQPSQSLMAALRSGEVDAVAAQLQNDLQPAALSLMPRLHQVLDAGLAAGARGAIVSGSGPTVAFLCADRRASVDLTRALNASQVADEVVSAVGPAPGAHVVAHPHGV